MDDNYSNTVKFVNLNHTATRPTEGQLKWARLHQKRVAVQVQRYVEWLYQCPASIQNVPTYHGEVDPFPSIDTNHLTIRISEGRRALLHVSNVEYERRKQYNAVNGYRFHRSTSDDESDHSTTGSHDEIIRVHFQPNQQILPKNCNNMPMSGNIPSTGRRKFRRRRKKFQPRCSDPERVRRFKEAFQVALHSLELTSVVSQPQHTHQPPSEELDLVDASSPNMERKKWRRPQVNDDECTYPADAFTVYGCSTVPKRPPSVHNPTWTPGKAPLDRGATWLNLLPASQTKTTDRRTGPVPPTPVPTVRNDKKGILHNMADGPQSHRSVLTPALRQHVADVAREIFSGDRSTSPRLSPLVGHGDILEREIHSFVDQFEEHWLQLESDSVDGHEEEDEDSVVPVWSPPPANDNTRPQGHHPIIPMVTYDSDDEHASHPHQVPVWNQKSQNLDVTFTQELDSSFHGWDRSTTTNTGTGTLSSPIMMLTTTEQGDNGDGEPPSDVTLIQRTDLVTTKLAVDDENLDGAMNVESPIQLQHDTIKSLPKKLLREHEMLELSPMNLKQIIRRLPDPEEIDDIIHLVSLRIGPLSVFDQRVSHEIPPRAMERHVTGLPVAVVVLPPPPYESIHGGRTMRPSPRPDRNATRDDHPTTTTTTSAGCGLYTERGGPFQYHHDHHAYDVAWERSWRL